MSNDDTVCDACGASITRDLAAAGGPAWVDDGSRGFPTWFCDAAIAPHEPTT